MAHKEKETMATDETNSNPIKEFLEQQGILEVNGTKDLTTALASQQNKFHYVFFHNAATPGPDTEACSQLLRELNDEGKLCIYVDTTLTELPPDIPGGDRIAKYFNTTLISPYYLHEATRNLNPRTLCIKDAVSGASNSHDEYIHPEPYYGKKNILILGESGVDNSTWINAFANFITFGTFEEAIQSENPPCLIPTSFPWYDKDLNEQRINIGSNIDNNENGQSQTKPKAHLFEMKMETDLLKLQIIDTPGMADAAGLEQDRQNIKNILDYIFTLDELELNCILILMDGNRNTMTTAFKYCIGQLLTHLHKDAAKNIVFVFINCGQRRNPGFALNSLRKYLEDVQRNNGVEVKTGLDQVYIMENDAFKFIYEVHQKVEFTSNDFKYMENSWSLSKPVSMRLLQHILSMQPHKTLETFSVYKARSYNLALAQQLAKIPQAIQGNVTVRAGKLDCFQTLIAKEWDFQATRNAMKIMQNYYEIEHVNNYPRMVCASAKHIEMKLDGQGQPVIHYKTICHSPCQCLDDYAKNNLSPGTYCNQIKNCWAIGGNDYCKHCGCHYLDHIHISYLQRFILKTKLVDDPRFAINVLAQQDEIDNEKAVLEANIYMLEKLIKDQLAEKVTISKHSATLSTFLKRHAIMNGNDVIEDCVLMSINNDEKQVPWFRIIGDLNKLPMYGQAAIFNTEHSINGQQQKAKSVDSSSSFSLITSTHPPQSNATKFNQMYRNEDGFNWINSKQFWEATAPGKY